MMPKGRLLWRFRKGSEWYEKKTLTPIVEVKIAVIPDNPYRNTPAKNGICPDCNQRFALFKYHKCQNVKDIK